MKVGWYFHRLRAMTIAELAHRVTERLKHRSDAAFAESVRGIALGEPEQDVIALPSPDAAPAALKHKLAHDATALMRGDWKLFGWREVNVGIMGMGVLGRAAARALLGLGFAVRGWSRSRTDLAGVTGFAGDELDAFLAGTDIVVCLLPLTPATEGILNRNLFGRLRRALPDMPVLINAARGGHQNEADLVTALRDGTLAAASLDVFAPEPLAAASPLWGLDNCYITPHVAAVSTAAAGVAYFARIIAAHEAGEPLPAGALIDRQAGY